MFSTGWLAEDAYPLSRKERAPGMQECNVSWKLFNIVHRTSP
jgi:hypothetical protein